MERIIAVAAAAAIALAATPALAKSKKHHRYHHGYYAQPYAGAPYPGAPFVEPQRVGSVVRQPRRDQLCARNRALREDLGYGRFEYCGW